VPDHEKSAELGPGQGIPTLASYSTVDELKGQRSCYSWIEVDRSNSGQIFEKEDAECPLQLEK